ncbi:MAG: hypothetical protein NT151_08575 [Acidobacteria bacterium]|nr:hypothetical protein [Acidobacteriota bacterium]
MTDWIWNAWLWQWLGFVLIGGGLIAGGLAIADHRRQGRVRTELGIPSHLPANPQINMAKIPVGGDIGGLVVVVGIFLACLPVMWGWFLAVGVGAVLVAVSLFIWHRVHPW